MGYETKLLIGNSTALTSNDTGRQETWFDVYATVDLSKCGQYNNLHKLDKRNNDKYHVWYWYDGDETAFADRYGDALKPVPAIMVIDALKKDLEREDNRRLRWALRLLESMYEDDGNITVLFFGH